MCDRHGSPAAWTITSLIQNPVGTPCMTAASTGRGGQLQTAERIVRSVVVNTGRPGRSVCNLTDPDVTQADNRVADDAPFDACR